MQILLIRHGQSEADLLDVHEGRADFPLTGEGIEQVKKMAVWVNAEYPPEMIWSSTLQRAAQTAAMLAEAVGCPVEYLDELQEHNNGELAGKPLQDHPFPYDILPHEKLGGTGESVIEFRGRLEQIFYTIKKRSEPYRRIAIVTHGGSIARILETFLQMPYLHTWFHTDDTGIHLLEYTERGQTVRFLNSTLHLKR